MSLTVTDLFAGAGGSSTGMVEVPGVDVVMAANHWDVAIDIHNVNHPSTDHAAVDLHLEDPRFFPRTDILWASPECTKWSQANGSKTLPAIEEGLFEDPNSSDAATRSRLLMFDVLRFIEHHRYRFVFVENVVDICTQAKYATAWHEWRKQARALGYKWRVISLNSMHAQAYGDPAPQSRDRIYIGLCPESESMPDFDRILRPHGYCGRCDRMVESRQAWKPGRTVGRYRQSYVYIHDECGTVVEPGYLPAASIIDWSTPGTPIGEGRLAEKTLRRIAAGIARYWGPLHIEAAGNQYDAADPKHRQHADPNAYYRAWPVQEYLRVLHTQETKALVVPVEGREHKNADPVAHALRTLTTRAETGFVSVLRGERADQAYRLDEAADVFCASGNHHALVTRHANIEDAEPSRHTTPASEELRTVTASGGNMSLLTPYYGNADSALPIEEPVGTLTTRDRYALLMRNNTGGAEMSTPVTEYMRTLTTTHGQQALIQGPPRTGRPRVSEDDIETALRMVPECLYRMLSTRESAGGQAFPRDYQWQPYDPKIRKKISDRKLTRAIGNAVTPPSARDLTHVVAEALGGAA